MSRKTDSRDYTLNKMACQDLADNIQRYWQKRGHKDVRVWVESIPVYDKHTGQRVVTRYEINSNIIQSVSSLERGHVTR